MSDFAYNNWEFARFVEKQGQQNSLKTINVANTTLPNPTQFTWESAGGVLREATNYTKPKKRKYNGIQLDTTRPNSSVPPIPPIPTLVVFSNNQNVFETDQQVFNQNYYI